MNGRSQERAVVDGLPGLLGTSREEFEHRMNATYVWPRDAQGRLYPQGDCSACRQIDARHPKGTACDFSCVGV